MEKMSHDEARNYCSERGYTYRVTDAGTKFGVGKIVGRKRHAELGRAEVLSADILDEMMCKIDRRLGAPA